MLEEGRVVGLATFCGKKIEKPAQSRWTGVSNASARFAALQKFCGALAWIMNRFCQNHSGNKKERAAAQAAERADDTGDNLWIHFVGLGFVFDNFDS